MFPPVQRSSWQYYYYWCGCPVVVRRQVGRKPGWLSPTLPYSSCSSSCNNNVAAAYWRNDPWRDARLLLPLLLPISQYGRPILLRSLQQAGITVSLLYHHSPPGFSSCCCRPAHPGWMVCWFGGGSSTVVVWVVQWWWWQRARAMLLPATLANAPPECRHVWAPPVAPLFGGGASIGGGDRDVAHIVAHWCVYCRLALRIYCCMSLLKSHIGVHINAHGRM